jgi:hypothetical protein
VFLDLAERDERENVVRLCLAHQFAKKIRAHDRIRVAETLAKLTDLNVLVPKENTDARSRPLGDRGASEPGLPQGGV